MKLLVHLKPKRRFKFPKGILANTYNIIHNTEITHHVTVSVIVHRLKATPWILIFFFFFFFFVGLGFELRVWTWKAGTLPLGKTCSPFWSGYFGDRLLWTVCLGWPQIAILLISASQVARITGVSHWCLALNFNLNKINI
jgi:hypothetical protein